MLPALYYCHSHYEKGAEIARRKTDENGIARFDKPTENDCPEGMRGHSKLKLKKMGKS